MKLCMQHRVLKYYPVCSNDDPGLTTYFMARSNLGWETEVYSNGPAHITKMAAMPIYGKNL